MKGDKVIRRIAEIIDLEGEKEEEFVKQYIIDKIKECFPDKDIDWNDNMFRGYLDVMIEEYYKNTEDAIRRGFSRDAGKIIGLLTVDRAIEIAKEKHDSVLNKGFYFGMF